MSEYLLYNSADDFYRWDYDEGTGFIKKGSDGSEYDAIQDQNIEANKQGIHDLRDDLNDNERRDEQQQQQLDLNDATDERQQSEIDNLASLMEENQNLDAEQQRQIDENIELDARQQEEIDANRENITRVEGEVTDYSVEGTTFVIKKRKEE